MPRVRCTRSLACKWKKHASKSPQVRRNATAFPAQWFYGLWRALLGVPGSIASVAERACRPQGLTPASGRRDHTLLPSATRTHRLCVPPRPSHPAAYVS